MNRRSAMQIAAILLLPVLSLITAPTAQSQFDPARVYPQSAEVRKRYPDPQLSYDTPGFRASRSDFTSHDEMLAWIEQLRRRSDVVHLRRIGSSQEGRAIPALVLSSERVRSGSEAKRLGRPVVVLAGLQHGNEPAGGEAMLVLARELSLGSLRPLLDRLTVVIIPHSNPDGGYYFRRSPYANTDINRDHVKVDLPETRALHRLVNEFEPHVFVDAHEFSVATRWIEKFGVIQSYDLLFQHATNPNVHPALSALAEGKFLGTVRESANRAGYSNFGTTPPATT
jgi:murein tripeptide amidase MpaA